ncbi:MULTISPECIES: DUF2290 domain-containing protein [Stutzerimonas]|uniref:DUF2290 domain-containing protein n=1 Tax=Stutzerimonas stutzeri TaxID=316 RepID=A0AA42T9Z9_STUST|nr:MULTISPECIES: DUF2290 domain-containing protein [Stutzerimonas]MDH1235393.1 DUF2290 domain-containing protein [Stutzerimonas stutzeri]MDL2173274.1 DUF2290 domain-containing protein [Stutzerimonas sp. FeSN7]HLC44400.1 DUF2290 domain-containing protein [Patescibacteria group bacterium]
MRFANACQGLINALERLRPIVQSDNTLVMQGERTISWRGRRPGILTGLYYPFEYQALIDSQQYSILLQDGSFFQFYYSFSNDESLIGARLAFYPRPLPVKDGIEEFFEGAQRAIDREDNEIYEHLYNWTEIIEQLDILPANTSHLRFDYDPSAKSHCKAHIQFSGINDLRIPADFVPLPLGFINFCEDIFWPGDKLNLEALMFEARNRLTLDHPGDLISLSSLTPK